MKPDLDAIRARWAKRGHSFDDRDEFERGARTDIPALLAYIAELEAAWRNERETFASCNRARQHCELECEDLRKRVDELEARTTHTVGETEWANRIAHAEERAADYRAEIDKAQAAFDHGCGQDGPDGWQPGETAIDALVRAKREREELRATVEELRARIVTLEAMR